MRPLIIQPLWPVDNEENLAQGTPGEVVEMLDARGVSSTFINAPLRNASLKILFAENTITSYNWTAEADTYESDSCGDEEMSDDEATSADESESSAGEEDDSVEAMEVGVASEVHASVKTT